MQERNPIRVLCWGLDAIGLEIARLVARRPGLELTGAICQENAGRDVGDVLGFGERLGVTVGNNPTDVLAHARPDVTLISAAARVSEIGPLVLSAMEAGSNIICVAEEMVYPWATRPDMAESVDELAHAHGVTILGTGLNPGFVMDTLVIALTGCCTDVERIQATRATDLAHDPTLFEAHGVGLPPGRFQELRERGRIAGHMGFEQSIHLIADALGWKLERVEEDLTPIIARTAREFQSVRVEPGQVAGTFHTAIGYVEGIPRIVLEHPQQLAPAADELETGDYITIEGLPTIRLAIEPEIPGIRGTAAVAVNMIPAVLQVGPGLKTMADLPVPRAVLSDVRETLVTKGPTIEEELAGGWHERGLGGNPEDEATGLRTM